jgi:transposase
MQRIEARYGRPIDELLLEMYVTRGLGLRAIADEFGLTFGVISEWLARCGIPARRPGQTAEVA